MLEDHTNGYLEEVREFADSIDMRGQLESRLEYLKNYSDITTRCRLYRDFAPYSFAFVMEMKKDEKWETWFAGGLIYHGPKERESFSVQLDPCLGWSVHT